MTFQTHRTQSYLFFSFLIAFLSVSISSFSQNEITIHSQEKVYLHIDKFEYYAGEDVWFKAYLVKSDSHGSETLSKIVYVELIAPNGSILERKTIKIAGEGSHGDFNLSSRLKSGTYRIRAYTNYMRNFDEAYFFRKTIFINSIDSDTFEAANEATSKIDVQFFPEGGYLIESLQNNIGFKAVDNKGKGIDIEGSLIDSADNTILNFKSSFLGMGTFQFIPKKGKNYRAVITHGDKEIIYNLPKALSTGVVIRVVEHVDNYGVYLESSLAKKLQNFTLLGAQRNGVLFTSKIESNNSQAVAKVPKSILKEGIVQFTLLNSHQKRIVERLAFYETGNTELDLTISSSKEHYQKRDLVELELSLDSIKTKSEHANISISVIDMSTVKQNGYELDIKSQILLNSELKGHIEKPGYYFYSDDPKRKEYLDILMLTQGWRQFIVNDSPINMNFSPEIGFKISGTIKKFYNHNKTQAADVSLTYDNTEEAAYENMTTNSNGRFTFSNLNFGDSTSAILQAKKPNLKQRKNIKDSDMSFYIELDSFVSPQVTLLPWGKSDQINENQEAIAIPTAYLQSLAEFGKETEHLDEVVLEQFLIDSRQNDFSEKRILYREPSQTFDFQDIVFFPNDNVLTFLRGRVPGIRITGEGVYLRASNSLSAGDVALVLVDGAPISGDLSSIGSIPLYDVDFVDIIKGPRAAIFGYRGNGGVIAIYSKNGSENPSQSKFYKRKGILNFIHPGYSIARKFYEPKYTIKNEDDKKVDYRSTLYWNPNVKFNKNGKASISFYSADFETTYRVDVQGITLGGQIIKAESKLYVK